MNRTVFVLLFPLLLAGQRGGPVVPGRQGPGGTQAVQAPAPRPEDFCTVSGQVFNGISGEPLGKATVRLRRTDAPPGGGGPARSYSAGSDAGGRFTIANVAPGKYRITATRTGFVDAEYGSRDPQRPGTVQSLDARQQLTGIVFRMTPHGVITGRIVDQDGEPMQSLTVEAFRYRYTQGRKQLASYGGDTTNDIGEYRVYGLPPGRYYIGVSPQRNFRNAGGGERQEEEYVTTFYPGTTEAAAAAPVDIGPGTQLRGFDMRMARRHTVRVSGRVTDSSGTGCGRTMVFLVPAQAPAPGTMRRTAGVDRNGAFEIRGVTPGSYTLVAGVAGRGQALAARLPLQVGNADLDNVAIAINPPVAVRGRVRIDGQAQAALSAVQVTLRSRDAASFPPGAPAAARVREDGAFTLDAVNPDLYSVVVSNLPDGFYVKSIAANGQDLMGPGLDLGRGTAGEVDILLSPNSGQVTGVAQNGAGQPAAGATVALVPQERERLAQPQYYRTAVTDGAGRFNLSNLDPGSYKLYAWQEVEPGAYMDPDYLRPFENGAQSVTIRENSREDLQVRAIE